MIQESAVSKVLVVPLLVVLVFGAILYSYQDSVVQKFQSHFSKLTGSRTSPYLYHYNSSANPETNSDMPLPGFRQISHEITPVRSGLPYRYTPPAESGINLSGAEFDVDPDLIQKLDLPPKSYFNLSLDTVREFSFVTAADYTHYSESMDCVASIQTKFPGFVIHYYDVGLTGDQRNNVSTWCSVQLHVFPLDEYPQHVSAIGNKCFKYLIIQDALKTHGAVFWVDASFRAKDNISQWDDVFHLALTNGGIVMAEYKPKSDVNIHWTDPMMFFFLVTDPTRQIWIKQFQSGAVLIYNTEWAFTRVLWWMYLCSLDGRCCPRQTTGSIQGISQAEFNQKVPFRSHCTDQAALNILLSNAHGFNDSTYVAPSLHLKFRRRPTEYYRLQVCKET